MEHLLLTWERLDKIDVEIEEQTRMDDLEVVEKKTQNIRNT